MEDQSSTVQYKGDSWPSMEIVWILPLPSQLKALEPRVLPSVSDHAATCILSLLLGLTCYRVKPSNAAVLFSPHINFYIRILFHTVPVRGRQGRGLVTVSMHTLETCNTGVL